MTNEVIIQGRLTADPELRYTENDNIPVCNFSIACERPIRKDEEKVADFFECVAWRTRAEFLERNFSKGDMIILTGRLFTENFTDKNGTKRTAVKIRVTEINFAGSTKKQREREESDVPPGLEGMIDFHPEETGDAFDDDDLPF